MSTVEARLFFGFVVGGTMNVLSSFNWSIPSSGFSSIAPSSCGSVAGVPGDSCSEPDVYTRDRTEDVGDGSCLVELLLC